MKKIIIIGLILLFVICANAENNSPRVSSGFGTGLDFVQMTSEEKNVYTMGAINGMLMAPVFGAPKNDIAWFEKFVMGMTNVQVAAIIEKYLKDNPKLWHQPLNILTFEAIKHDHARENQENK